MDAAFRAFSSATCPASSPVCAAACARPVPPLPLPCAVHITLPAAERRTTIILPPSAEARVSPKRAASRDRESKPCGRGGSTQGRKGRAACGENGGVFEVGGRTHGGGTGRTATSVLWAASCAAHGGHCGSAGGAPGTAGSSCFAYWMAWNRTLYSDLTCAQRGGVSVGERVATGMCKHACG